MRRILAISFIIMAIFASVGLLVFRGGFPANAKADSPYVKSGNGQEDTVQAIMTFYGFNDNSGQTESQHGSADIGFPKNDGNPTMHNKATEGAGTFDDPITFATRNNDHKTFPVGSLIYVPLTEKYYIMEDECGDTDPQGCLHGNHHIDLWMGPSHVVANSKALADCADNNTPDSSVKVFINPSPDRKVDTTPEFNQGKCTIQTY